MSEEQEARSNARACMGHRPIEGKRIDLIDWRDGRVAEGAPLLREYGLKTHRGFESLSLRHTAGIGAKQPNILKDKVVFGV